MPLHITITKHTESGDVKRGTEVEPSCFWRLTRPFVGKVLRTVSGCPTVSMVVNTLFQCRKSKKAKKLNTVRWFKVENEYVYNRT